MRRLSSWRWRLDPRDPDYEEPPPEPDADDFDEPPEPAWDDPGPYHYIPPGEH